MSHVVFDTNVVVSAMLFIESVNLILPKDANIYASQYQLYLPSKQELKAQLESIQEELGRLRENAA